MSWHLRDPKADKFCPHKREFFPNGKLLPRAQPHCQDHKASAPGYRLVKGAKYWAWMAEETETA